MQKLQTVNAETLLYEPLEKPSFSENGKAVIKTEIPFGSYYVKELATPKTGDNSNVGLWTALAGLSALGIVGTAVVAYRKKKKEENE